MPENTCWTLIAAAAAGDDVQRDEFTRRYRPVVEASLAARWRHSPLSSEIDDAVQEVFLACFKHGGALERAVEVARGFRAFLYGVTRNVALQMERAQARRVRRVMPGVEREAGSENSGLSIAFDRAYARCVVQQAFETMANRARVQGEASQRRVELLRERFGEGHPIREIAKAWEADARELHLEQAKAGREFRSALREVVGLNERCPLDRLEVECDRLLALLD